ncbi:hypothetical protein [Paenibacillus faecalis]|uniref:hypothetical protein n=1 Tax=Paenibacillus faecalis TaxID=2079532 RepID=UPI000D10502F|nr:hypothetical protein [Paenibacillus faecalis]
MKKILVTAETFGYGPVITCLKIIEELKKYVTAHFVFLGSGISLEQAKFSGIFDEVVECDTFSGESLRKMENYFIEANFLISSENIEGAIYGVELGKRVFYIDNLFWMWDEIPLKLWEVDTYFIVESLDFSENINKYSSKINNPMVVGPIRDMKPYEERFTPTNQLLLNFGGAESFMIDQNKINNYYLCILEIIDKALDLDAYSAIKVCGGKCLIDHLKQQFRGHLRVSFHTFTHTEYLKELYTSKSSMLSPGLGNYLESLKFNGNVFFIPPINYSQFRQLEEYKQMDIGYYFANWTDLYPGLEVIKNVSEEEGIAYVLNHVECFINDSDVQANLGNKMREFFALEKADIKEERLKKLSTYQSNGVWSVVKNIIKRGVESGDHPC